MTTFAWFVRGAKHAAMCRQSLASVRKVDPKSACFVFTDEPSPAWVDQIDCGVARLESGMPLMMANIEAQISALVMSTPNEDVWFLDTDILLVAQPPSLFGDLAVTWRDHVGLDENAKKVEGVAQQMPYNYGVMGFLPGIESLEALIWIREKIRGMAPALRNWYGNQVALAQLCGPAPKDGTRRTQRRIPWTLSEYGRAISISSYPCEWLNYTPAKADEDINGKVALHFKGHSRELMQGYAERLGVA